MSAKGRERKPRLRRAATLLAALSFGSCSSPSPPRETPPAAIVLAGAEHLTTLLRGEILVFRDRYPGAGEIKITPDGSAEGMERLVNGEVDMSVLTRDLTDPEVKAAVQREGLSAFAVAWDAVAVIVNPRTPVEQISRSELGQIYRGEIENWSELGWRAGGRIAPLTTVPKWGLYEFIQQSVLGGSPYGPGVYAQDTEQAIVDIVASRKDAIGCVSRGLVDGRVRALKLSAAIGLPYIALDRESLVLRTYPLMRSLSLCTRSKPPSTASEFITFVASVDGQQIIARHGYAPATVPIQIVRTVEEEE